MKLYIQIENGTPINHPALEENLMAVYNGNIPNNWEPFERVVFPTIGTYQVLENELPTYKKIDNVWKDYWDIREMTTEEKLAKQQLVKDTFDKIKYSSWIFNENICEFEPPIPQPIDGKNYFWDENNIKWVENPDYPTDGLNYSFDYNSMKWVKI